MELILQLLLWCPKCWQKAGWWIVGTSFSLAMIGWRLGRRVDRIEDRTGVVVNLEKALEHVPFVPATLEGFVLLSLCAVAGGLMIYLGGWAKKFS